MNIPFSKFSGAGNDFIMIDNREQRITRDGIQVTGYAVQPKKLDLETFIIKVCKRGLSVGADGVILVEKSEVADFKMRYFNADGSEADTCGNGARCTARFAYLKGIALRKMRFETRAGIYDAEITEQDTIKVKMSDPGQPTLNILVAIKAGTLKTHFINTGVPHVVVFVSDIIEMQKRPTILSDLDVFNLGRELRYHPEFQLAGTNVNFVKIENKQTLRIRTYERGVENETLACGTGSIASTIVAYRLGKMVSPVAVQTQGGSILKIYFEVSADKITNVYLEGDARFIYEGILFDEAIL
ncbi:MAG: diaminopimelate epimerase [bacterium]|nr:diaminopimelate epimerase [bacterium]